jgi:hypothetical protein
MPDPSKPSKPVKLVRPAKSARPASARPAPAMPAMEGADPAAAAPVADESTAPTASFEGKFDLGLTAPTAPAPDPRTIPWGYGMDRITAMVVDPQRLYVYWEVTDGAIERARLTLGAGGAGAWLSLRVYDITGRLFDGTNAHSYFDEGIDRGVRQWFFEIGKPNSTACVEVGLKSAEGYFAKIARSGRVDFAPSEPRPGSPIEWLTVRSATGHAGESVAGGAPRPDGFGAPIGSLGGDSADGWHGWTEDAGFPLPGGGVMRTPEQGWELREGAVETYQTEFGKLDKVEWIGPMYKSEWQAGPFAYPVDAPSLIEHHETGEISMRSEDGQLHVVYGPWQVVIRGVGARAERRVLATWEYRRTVAVQGDAGVDRDDSVSGWWEPVGPGSSAWRLVGASERRWPGASELLVRGGSEVYMLGASERLYGGASERLLRGASERLYRGASERRPRGASERRLGGASERTLGGASERSLGGASERVIGAVGASENAPGPPEPATGSPYPRPKS